MLGSRRAFCHTTISEVVGFAMDCVPGEIFQFEIPQFDERFFPRMKQVYLVDGLTSIWVLRFRGDAASGFADTAICICKENEGLQHTLLVLFVRPHWKCTSYHSRRIPISLPHHFPASASHFLVYYRSSNEIGKAKEYGRGRQGGMGRIDQRR